VSSFLIFAGITDDQAMGSDGEDDLPVLKRIEADLKSGSNTDISSPDGKQVDLFSEIHLNELKKLEKQLEQVRVNIVKTMVLEKTRKSKCIIASAQMHRN
jgi:protein bicaudal D